MSDFFKAFLVVFSSDKKLYYSIKNIFGFYPRNIRLYQKALRHSSIASKIESPSNERLEYLGDAIFGAVVAYFLYQKFPYKDEGFLTKMRSRIVSRQSLNQLALKLGIELLVETGYNKKTIFKSVYGDAFEALIGAVYLDKGYDFTLKLIINRIIKYHIDIEELEKTDRDYKSKIINWCQRERKNFVFKTEEEAGSEHQKIYKVVLVVDQIVRGRGSDFSKKRAEQQAAEIGCLELNIP
ncbi:MAG: ribonuclease III [Bacteroidetes bacterium]|nr:ribonuclease III [Bacteroidota bacterium]HET6245460.1 ribonuclease III [Bacteroidia bacterium]